MKRKLWKSMGFTKEAVKGENRKSRRSFSAAVAAVMAAVLLSGCGAKGYSSDSVTMAEPQYNGASASYTGSMAGGAYDAGYMETESVKSDSMATMDIEAELEENGGAFSNLPQDRKLIRTVDLEMETKEFDQMMSELEKRVQELGGYIENLETYNGSSYTSYRSSRWANMEIRIPRESLNGFLESVSAIGNVVRRSDRVEDVTLTYVDMESRRDTLKAEQARLLELLEQAETVEDMIALEERLSNVRYGLESMESKLRTMDNQVDYSTVNLSLSEVKELTPVEERTDLQRITEGFADSLKDIGNGIKEGAIWFVVNIPYLVIWAAVIAVLALILKKYRKKRKEKKAALKADATAQSADRVEQAADAEKVDSRK